MSESDWKAALPEELRADPALADVRDVAGLAKRFVDTQAMVGRSIRPPSPDAPPEVKKEFREKMLKLDPELAVVALDDRPPENENGYSFEGLEVPEGVKLDEAALRATAKALGLSKKAAKELARSSVETQHQSLQAAREADKALRAEWGAAYEERTLSAKAMALKLGIPEAAVHGMGAAQLKVWANVAKAIGGDGRAIAGQPGTTPGKPTPSEARARIAEILADPDYFNAQKNPARHSMLREKMLEAQGYAAAG